MFLIGCLAGAYVSIKELCPFYKDATGVLNPGIATNFSVLFIESCCGEFYSEISCTDSYSESEISFSDIFSD